MLEDVGSLYTHYFIYIIQSVIPICFIGLGRVVHSKGKNVSGHCNKKNIFQWLIKDKSKVKRFQSFFYI